MARTARSRTIAAAPERVWELIADPHHLPRWWPGVVRVEAVTPERFTLVFTTKRGRPVRMDQQVLESLPPGRRSWSQQLPGTPFERLLNSWTTTITVAVPSGRENPAVTIVEQQELKGSFRLGWLLQLRPARRRLDAALTALAELLESQPPR